MSTLEREDVFDLDPSTVPLWEQRLRRSLWPIVGFTAWAVFELTSELWASTLVLCAHYGWSPFATGCWLWWNDPWRERGRCSLLAFCGHALGRVVLAGFIITVFLTPLAINNRAIETAVRAAAFVPMIGLVLMMVFLWLALFLARLNNVRLWVNGQVHRSARGQWPPTSPGNRNRMKSNFWLSSFLGAIIGAILLPWFFPVLFPAHETLATFALFLGSFALAFVFYGGIASRSIALFPGDCWPDLADDPAADFTRFSGWN